MLKSAIHFPGHGTYTRDWLSEHPKEVQALLERCKGRVPTCRCKKPWPAFYIGKRRAFYLARLPNTGAEHATECPSYSPPFELSGRGLYARDALCERDDGSVSLRVDAPLEIIGLRDGDASNAQSQVSAAVSLATTKAPGLKLRGLLHLIWETAGFNRWSPNMEGRRQYRQIYKFCRHAADRITIQEMPLNERLFIPEPFVSQSAKEISVRRAQLLRTLSFDTDRTPRRVLALGQLKRLCIDGERCGLNLAQTPPQMVLWCNRQMVSALRRDASHAFSLWPDIDDDYRVFVLLTMSRTERTPWVVARLSPLVTNGRYIPVISPGESAMADILHRQGRHFHKPLSYDDDPGNYPSFLLTDAGDAPVPVQFPGPGACAVPLPAPARSTAVADDDRSR